MIKPRIELLPFLTMTALDGGTIQESALAKHNSGTSISSYLAHSSDQIMYETNLWVFFNEYLLHVGFSILEIA